MLFRKKKEVYKLTEEEKREKKKKAEKAAPEPSEPEEAEETLPESPEQAEKPRRSWKGILKDRKRTGMLFVGSSLVLLLVVAPGLNMLTTIPQAQVVVAVADIPKGTLIDSSMLTTATVPEATLLPIHLPREELAAGSYACSDIVAGEYLSSIKLSSEVPYPDGYLYEIPEGKRVVSVTFPGLASSLSSKLQAGDIVSVYLRDGDKTKTTEAILHEQLQYVKVLGITNGEGYTVTGGAEQSELEEPLAETALLLADEVQARLLAGMDGSNLHFALVYRGSEEQAAAYLARQDALNRGESSGEEIQPEAPEPEPPEEQPEQTPPEEVQENA